MTTYQIVIPAYGRDYRTKTAALAAWEAGADFRCEPQGCYITKTEADEHDLTINIRYNRLQNIVPLYAASRRVRR